MAASVDFRALERESYGLDPEAPANIQLTPELIGRLVACVLQVYGRDPHEVVPPNYLEQLFLRSHAPIPDGIAKTLHIEKRVDGERVEELTQMTVGPQASGIAGRVNPDNVSLIPKSDRLQAYTVLEHYSTLFPAEVAWLKAVLNAMANADSEHQHNERSRDAT